MTNKKSKEIEDAKVVEMQPNNEQPQQEPEMIDDVTISKLKK